MQGRFANHSDDAVGASTRLKVLVSVPRPSSTARLQGLNQQRCIPLTPQRLSLAEARDCDSGRSDTQVNNVPACWEIRALIVRSVRSTSVILHFRTPAILSTVQPQ